MVNLSGLNNLSAVQPLGTQQRSQATSASSVDNTAPASFKDALGRAEEKPVGEKSPREVPAQPNRRAMQGAKTLGAKKSLSPKQSPDESIAPLEVDGTQPAKENVMSDEATDASANALPGSIGPGNGLSQAPDFAVNKAIVAGPFNDPSINKSSEIVQDVGMDSLSRRAVWNDFLRRMQDELGVSAEDVLEAFSTLDEVELASAPEQNVDKLVMALGLNQDQSKVAEKLFKDLLGKTKSSSIGAELANSATQINLTLMSQREMQRRQIESSIDKMNTNFFMSRQGALRNQPQPVPAVNQELGKSDALAAGMVAPELMTTTPATTTAVAAVPVPAPASASSPALASSVPAAPPVKAGQNSNVLGKLLAEMEPVSAEESSQFAQAIEKSKTQMLREPQLQAANVAAPMVETSSAPALGTSSQAAQGVDGAGKAFAQTLGLSSAGSEGFQAGEENPKENGDQSLSSQFMASDRNFSAQKTEGAFKVNMPVEVQAPVQTMGVPDLIQNTRLMVHAGGGEMKVSLTPEGLGEVALKVNVENGRVNVEMITESDTAKSMIEKSLVDLKSNLHANNLSLESIKIDTASSMGKQLDQQYQDAQRQQAHQFLENFRQEQQGWRREPFATPSASLRGSQASADGARPTPYVNSSSKRNNSRRLDLVA